VTRSRVLDIDCFVGDVDSAAQAVIERAASGLGGYACLANVHVMATARRIASLREALEIAWAVFPDGAPIAWLQRRIGAVAARRVAGPDLMLAVFDRGRQVGIRHFLFGSTPAVVADLESHLSERYPGVEIAGTYSPANGQEDTGEALAGVRAAEAHIVWVALGAPKQEVWARTHAPSLAPSLVLPVGAAFDFNAHTKPRAPLWMQRSGLEWLHRLATEPSRLGWRYLSTNTRFLVLAAGTLLATRHSAIATRDAGPNL
jgi:N-acetylglucosaminyldiphosphoundecaprenol N-acetyl-beta-D-mannosaminyltransferase